MFKMQYSTNKVGSDKVPASKYQNNDNGSKNPKSNLCACKTIRPSLLFLRIFGLSPIIWTNHADPNGCRFSVSKFLLLYSVFMICLCVIEIFNTINELSDEDYPLPVYLFLLSNCIYTMTAAVMIFFVILKSYKFARVLNKFTKLIAIGLMCDKASRVLLKAQYFFIFLFFIILLVQYGVLLMMILSDKYETNWNYDRFIIRTIANIPYVFFSFFCMTCATFIILFTCFEKIVIKSLNFESTQAIEDITTKNGKRKLFGFIKYDVCINDHVCLVEKETHSAAFVLDKLRRLHENMCVAMRDTNDCINPNLLIGMSVELTLTVIHCYSVIISFKYNDVSDREKSLNILNWMYIAMHVYGLSLILKIGDQVSLLITGLNDFLLEYSTYHLSIDEHQQIRIFMNKLKYTVPNFSAGGIVDIGLHLAAPICGNILTYVLVALQFRPS